MLWMGRGRAGGAGFHAGEGDGSDAEVEGDVVLSNALEEVGLALAEGLVALEGGEGEELLLA